MSVFLEKVNEIRIRKEEDPWIEDFVELLSDISHMTGRQRTKAKEAYVQLYCQKFSLPSTVDRSKTEGWKLFSSFSNGVLNQDHHTDETERKTISLILRVLQRYTSKATVVSNAVTKELAQLADLITNYEGKFKSQVILAYQELKAF